MAVVGGGASKSSQQKKKNTSKVAPNGGDPPIDTSPHGNILGGPGVKAARGLTGDRENATNKIRGFATATSMTMSSEGTRGATKVASASLFDNIVNDPFPVDHEQRRLSVMGLGGGTRTKYEEEMRMASVGGGGE